MGTKDHQIPLLTVKRTFIINNIIMKMPFLPSPLPVHGLDENVFVEVPVEASRELCHYDGMVRTLVNPDRLLSPPHDPGSHPAF